MPDFTSKAFNLSPSHGADSAPIGHKFGDVLGDNVQPTYSRVNNSVVSVTFVAGNPRNNIRLDDTFLTVEQKQSDGSWEVVRTDDDYDTRFHWKYTVKLLGLSRATIEWYLNKDTPGKCLQSSESKFVCLPYNFYLLSNQLVPIALDILEITWNS